MSTWLGTCTFVVAVMLLAPDAKYNFESSIASGTVQRCVFVLWTCAPDKQCQAWRTTFVIANQTSCVLQSQTYFQTDAVIPVVVHPQTQTCTTAVGAFQLSRICWTIIALCYLISLVFLFLAVCNTI